MTTKSSRLIRLPCRQHVFDHHRGGRPRARHAQALRIIQLNPTSVQKHFNSIASIEGEIIALTETKATDLDQQIATRRCRAHRLQVLWGEPVGRTGTINGRSGGVAILAREGWHLHFTQLHLELEAASHNWIAARATSKDGQHDIMVLAYYGHPEALDQTERDIRRIRLWAEVLQHPLALCIDGNIDDADRHHLPHTIELQDAAVLHHHRQAGEMVPTNIGPYRSSRIDRCFLSEKAANAFVDYEVMEEYHYGAHRPIRITLAMTSASALLHTAPPPIPPAKVGQVEEVRLRQEAHQRAASPENCTLDTAYSTWSAAWESYLYAVADIKSYTPQRGSIEQPSVKNIARLAITKCHRTRRVANYLATLQTVIASLREQKPVPQGTWRKLLTTAVPLANWYGAPQLHLENPTQHDIAIRTLEITYDHFRKIYHQELDLAMADRIQEAKMRLNANHGINRKAAATLKQTAQNTPVMVKDAEDIVVDYPTMHKLIDKAWSKFYGLDPGAPTLAWTQQYLQDLPHELLQLEPVTDEELMSTLKDSNRQTTAGPDGWRTDELCRLPPEAIAQLGELLRRCEQMLTFPQAMTTSWTSMIPKTAAPQPPLALRPIAVLSATYRLYATTRQRSMVAWFKRTAPPCVYSYLPGRDAHDAGLAIAAEIEAAKINQQRHMHHGIYIASLDASKAFPSASRSQLWAILTRMGMPTWVAELFEAGYAQGQTTHRLDGRFVAEAPHRLRRGIYQGCPVSTMAFVSLQVPLVGLIKARHPSVKPIIYADDLTVIAMNHQDLQSALWTICEYYNSVHIQLNASKTQYWSLDTDPPAVQVGDAWVKATPSITVLGQTFHSTTKAAKPMTLLRQRALLAALRLLALMPLYQQYKEGLYAAVTCAKWNYSPWSYTPTETQDAAIRTRIISTLYAHLRTGPRSPHMAMLLLTKIHKVDPYLSRIWSMVAIVSRGGREIATLVQEAYDHRLQPTTPISALAQHLRELGGILAGGIYVDHTHQPISILRPRAQVDLLRWQHRWRAILKHAYFKKYVVGRREWQDLQDTPIDHTTTMAWWRSLPQGPQRSALQAILTGAIITGDRAQRQQGCVQPCILCNHPTDDEIHHYWECPMVAADRDRLLTALPPLPQCTKLTGVIPMGSFINPLQAQLLQQYMVRVIQRHQQAQSDTTADATTNHTTPQLFVSPAQPQDSTRPLEGRGLDQNEQDNMLDTAAGSMHRPNPRAGLLPDHIRVARRSGIGSAEAQRVLTCSFCGAVANMTCRARFVNRHFGCKKGIPAVKCVKRNRLRRAECEALSDQLGHDIVRASKRTRRALANAFIELRQACLAVTSLC